VTLFQELYLPILEELRLPYILLYDFFAMGAFIPKDLDAPTFKRARRIFAATPTFGVATCSLVQTL
jgi:hypothetical protein